ncbi:MAG: ABC transporter substrate-binding protein [Armatimonadetes bacterium]|nr:ABC transporter substrate-binding protein [Armatimonadota bacterium]
MTTLFAALILAAVIPPKWDEVAKGVWRGRIGAHDSPTLTEAAEAVPRSASIKAKSQVPFDLKQVKMDVASEYARVELPLAKGEKIFGLGLQMKGSDRRGGVYHLQVDHYAEGHDRLHAPTPFYVSSRGYAVFFNTTRPINVYVGVGNRTDRNDAPARDRNTDPKWDAQPDSGHVEASVQGPGIEVLVFEGPTAMDAVRRYVMYCGGGAMPPQWALGFWHRTPSLATAKQVEDEAGEFDRRGFPLDVIGLEPGWQSTSYPGTMEWDPGRFPNPDKFLKGQSAMGVHVNLWENPYVKPGSKLAEALQPGFGSHTVWLGLVPDINLPRVAKAERDFHAAEHLDKGVSGYKIDEVDGFDNWLWPDHATFPSGLSGIRMRQIYGVLWQRELTRLFEERNERTFGLVRGSNGAATRFPFAIYSDTYDHRQYVTALTSSSLAGVLWCAEIRSASTDEEWVRRMQSACLSPIAQLNAWDSGKKPWSYPAVEKEVKEAMLLRESLVPYLYTTFWQYASEGTPPVRPMCLVDGGEETDQYLLGDDLLVAPMFVGETSRKVRLPAGKWYDYQTGKYVGSQQTVEISPKLAEIPLFVRGGRAIPTFAGATRAQGEAYLPRCYGDGPWAGQIYEDDGKSVAYRSGAYGFFDLTSGADKVSQKHLAGSRRELARKLLPPLIVGKA